jgi:homoserine O-acetyltransferase/O-succinyltransferase
MLEELEIKNFKNSAGKLEDIHLSYQYFGKKPAEAPIILVNHALTGNSLVTGSKGWWKDLIGKSKCIDIDKFCILAFNIPGNGSKGHEGQFFDNYRDRSLWRKLGSVNYLPLLAALLEVPWPGNWRL